MEGRLLSNDSTVRGYLTPVGDGPQHDEALEREVSRWIRGVPGLPAFLVFPRWTDPQSQIPNSGMTWYGFGTTTVPQPLSQSDIQVSEEQSEQWIQEQVTVTCCFYEPQGVNTVSTFRAGILVEQNNAELNRLGLSLVEAEIIYNPLEFINNQQVRRYDLTITLSRKNIRTCNVRTLRDVPVSFFED